LGLTEVRVMAGLVPAIVRPRGRFVSVVEVHARAVRRPGSRK
jgi:hypothetical protein